MIQSEEVLTSDAEVISELFEQIRLLGRTIQDQESELAVYREALARPIDPADALRHAAEAIWSAFPLGEYSVVSRALRAYANEMDENPHPLDSTTSGQTD